MPEAFKHLFLKDKKSPLNESKKRTQPSDDKRREGESYREFKDRNRLEQRNVLIEHVQGNNHRNRKRKDFFDKKKSRERPIKDEEIKTKKDIVKFNEVVDRPPDLSRFHLKRKHTVN